MRYFIFVNLFMYVILIFSFGVIAVTNCNCISVYLYLYFCCLFERKKIETKKKRFVVFLNVMALQFCEQYLSNSVVLSYCFSFATMDIWRENYIRKNSYLSEGWLFIGRFKVGSLPRTIHQELLAKLCINLPNQLKNCLPWKNLYFK